MNERFDKAAVELAHRLSEQARDNAHRRFERVVLTLAAAFMVALLAFACVAVLLDDGSSADDVRGAWAMIAGMLSFAGGYLLSKANKPRK